MSTTELLRAVEPCE